MCGLRTNLGSSCKSLVPMHYTSSAETEESTAVSHEKVLQRLPLKIVPLDHLKPTGADIKHPSFPRYIFRGDAYFASNNLLIVVTMLLVIVIIACMRFCCSFPTTLNYYCLIIIKLQIHLGISVFVSCWRVIGLATIRY